MSALAENQRQWTEQEYLAFERASEEKHEFVDGQIIAMAGCTEAHDQICSNLYRLLGQALLESPCRMYTSEMKIHIPASGRKRYPDASVSCEPAYLDDTKDVLTTPCAIFEVLSDSTEKTDRVTKFDEYRSVPAFQEYVLVRQHMMLVEHYSRETSGKWTLQILPAGETLRLGCAPVEIPVRDLYHKAVF